MFQNVQEVFAWMDENCGEGIQPGLHRMESALDRLNHPERRCKFIHIAGTNGKGSTAAMIASVLQEAGYRTGMFISPSIGDWNDQITVDGKPITEEQFLYWASRLRELIEQMVADGEEAPTSYEFWTLLAICYFALDQCPWFIVWETGLGGRLDSTNVVYPLVSVITEIGLDHKEFLGDSIQQIAREKAGIIKSGIPVVCGSTNPTAVKEIAKIASEKSSRIYIHGTDFQAKAVAQSAEGQKIDFADIYRSVERLPVSLIGEHQVRNAATALMTLDVLRQKYATVIEDLHLEKGFSSVRWPGRLEKIADDPMILLDGAHNEQSVQALSQALSQLYTYNKLTLIVALMKEKEAKILEPLFRLADQVIATQVTGNPRSKTAEQFSEELTPYLGAKALHSFENIESALKYAQENASSNDLILVAGSLYLIAETRKLLIGTDR